MIENTGPDFPLTLEEADTRRKKRLALKSETELLK
jgi:hypothetical protein